MYPGRGFPPRKPRIRENVNEAIRAREVRAVFPDGKVEIMPTPAAVRRAREMGLDLILVAPTAEPPVAKAMDYGQWQYETKKKQQEAKKKQTVIETREIKFRPKTEEHDLSFKIRKIKEFLAEKNKVKVTMRFRGREMAHQEIGMRQLERVRDEMGEMIQVESMPKLEGRQMVMMIAPSKKKTASNKSSGEKKQQSEQTNNHTD